MKWSVEYHKMACKVFITNMMVPPEDHLGLAYECFALDMDAYDETKCDNPVVYFAYRLRERIQRERRYGGVVHVPVMRKATEGLAIASLSEPLSEDDGSLTIGDMLEGEIEAENAEELIQTEWLSIIDILKLTPAEKRMVPMLKEAILSGISIPYDHKIASIKKKLLKKIKEH